MRRSFVASMASLAMTACDGDVGPPDIGDPSLPTIPPRQTWVWDFRKKNSEFTREFRVTDNRDMLIYLAFKYTPETNLPRLQKLIGDGSFAFYVNDPQDPRKIRPGDPVYGDLPVYGPGGLSNLAREGVLTRKTMNPGVIIPIRIVIEEMPYGKPVIPIIDKIVQTEGTNLYGGSNAFRFISAISARHRRYRMQVIALSDTDIPQDTELGVSLHLSYI
jgi:hypothetical protein